MGVFVSSYKPEVTGLLTLVLFFFSASGEEVLLQGLFLNEALIRRRRGVQADLMRFQLSLGDFSGSNRRWDELGLGFKGGFESF